MNETALQGTLARKDQGWVWSDGTLAPEVLDLLLNHCAPSFRCITYGCGTFVELPRYWPDRVDDADVAEAIAVLVAETEGTREASIYAEGVAEAMHDHRRRTKGYLIPIAKWDEVMSRIVGAQWLKAHEEALLAKARSLGWEG